MSHHIMIVARKQLWQKNRKCTSELQGRATSHGPYSAIRLESAVFLFVLSLRTESFSEVISFPFANYIYNIHKLCTAALHPSTGRTKKKGTQRIKIIGTQNLFP